MANQQPPAAAMVPPSLQAGGELASGGSIRSRRDRRLSGRLQQRASSGGEEALAVDLGAIAAESAPAPTASATSSTPPDSRNPASARGALASLARDRDAERDSPGVRGPSVRFGPDQVVEMGAAPLPSAMVAAGNRGSRGRDGVLKKSVEAATDADAARGWLRDHGFAEPEAEEVEALMGADEIGEFTVKTLNGLGETGVRAVVRGHAGRADGDDVQPRRSRTPNRTGRDAAPPAVCGCSSSPPGSQGGAGRRAKSPASQRRAESPPRDEEAVSNGMFVLLHKNEGRSAPHKRFFRFDGDSQIVTWSKKMPKVMAADDADRAKAEGKYAKVISAKADVPVVRANRGKEDDQDFAARCLRLQTLNHGTLALEMPRASDALLWLNIIRDAGVIAEDLSVVTAQETRLQEQSGGPKVDTKSTGPLGRLRSLSNALPAQGKSLSFDGENEDDESDDSDDDADDDGRGGDLIDTTAISEAGIDEDEDLDGQGVLSKEESRLTADEWTLAQDAFDSIAKRNIDILKSPYEQMATRRMQKFQALGPEVEIQLMDNLLRKEYAKNERLIVQGEEGSEFFILLEGSCTIEVDGKYVREVSAPNAFGENALITKAKRTGTIRAKSDIVVVAVLNKATFDHLSARQEYPSFWRRSSLKTKFSAAHQKRLGQTGEITSFSVGTNEVEVKFDDGELLHFPTGALGLEPTVGTAHTTTSGDSDGGGDIPGSSEAKEDKKDDTNIDPVIRACDAPTNSETRTLGIMEDWMLRREELKLEGRRVAVMRDINVAQSYFQRVEEVYHVDQYALTTSTAYFLFAWMLGSVLGFNWGSAVIGLILVINAFVSERSRHSRLYSEVKARVHGRWHRAIERRSREESPEWINHIIAVSWREMGIEKMLSDQIKDIANPMLADISTWYPQVDDISIASLTLGKAAPQINNLHFENSDIFGEFRVNAEAKLDAPDCKATIRVDMTPTPFNLAVADLNVNVDFQLLVRLSSDNGLTLVGVKLRKKLGLDYAISHKLKKNLNSIAGFAVQKVLNDLIHESLWWMSHPCMLLLPWQDPAVTGSPSFVAGSDMEASQFDKPVGQLEIRVKSARHLPVGDWRTNSSDPYVQFLVEKSWPLRQFRTRMVSRNLNPVFEHSAMTTLRWNESQTGIILFEVYDHNEVGSADKLGMAEVPIKMVARKSDSYFKWENRVKLRELSDEKTRGHRAAYLCLSLTYHPAHMSRRVPMLYSGGNEIDNVRGGVLQLEVVSVRNLQHAQDKLYVIIEYGKSFDHSKRSADAWRHGGEKNASRSEAYNPGVFHNDHYRSHEVDPKVFLEKMPENQRREVVQNNYPVVWRDQPIGYKAEHEICVEDCRNAVQISIMTPEIGKVS
jgi:CRP-like cAMP-binding protein